MGQCTATTKSGARCKKDALEGKRKCLQHDTQALKSRAGKKGGRPRKPIHELSPAYRRQLAYYRPVFSKKAYTQFEEYMCNPELYSIKASLAVSEIFKLDALATVWDREKSQAEWVSAFQLYRQMNEAIRNQDDPSAKFANEQLGKVLAGGMSSEAAKREFVGLSEHQSRLIQTEIKKHVALESTFTAREVADILEVIGIAVMESFTNASEVERFVQKVGSQGACVALVGALGSRKQSA